MITKTKIYFFVFFLLAIPIGVKSQAHHFSLVIHFVDPSVKTLGIGEAYYYKIKPYHAAKIKVDTANVRNNTYTFEGTTLYPTALRIWPQNSKSFFNKLVFIDTGYQEISIVKKDSSYFVVGNTEIEQEHQKFMEDLQVKTLDDKMEPARLLAYVQNHPKSYVALFAILNQAFQFKYLPAFDAINSSFAQKIQTTKAFQCYLSLYPHKSNEQKAKDFLGTDLKGEQMNLSDVKGKGFVLLAFWGSWCAPCRRYMPHLKELYSKYHSKGLQIVAIAFDTNTKDWRKGVKEEGIQEWTNIYAGQPYSMADTLNISATFGIQEFPTMILLNKDGNSIARFDSEDQPKSELDKVLSKLYKE